MNTILVKGTDHNLGYACVGYGVVRALSQRSADAPFTIPAALVLQEPDPIAFCIEAMAVEHPDWAARVSKATRAFIDTKLREEAARA
jgi:hypothetical protein